MQAAKQREELLQGVYCEDRQYKQEDNINMEHKDKSRAKNRHQRNAYKHVDGLEVVSSKVQVLETLLSYLLTYLLHGAESFLRS
jgi:hypothetical protein